jgi:hypothetical protein
MGPSCRIFNLNGEYDVESTFELRFSGLILSWIMGEKKGKREKMGKKKKR